MKKIAILFATLALSGASLAQSMISKADVKDLVVTMVDVYKADKGAGMRTVETECWKAMKRGEDGVEGGVAYCSMLSITGNVIESLASEKAKRKPMAYWGDDAMANRIVSNVKRLGMSESAYEKKVQPEVDAHMDFITDTLVKTGIAG